MILSKLLEIDTELARQKKVKEENYNLKKELEQKLAQLHTDAQEFEQGRQADLQELTNFRENELK